MGQSLFDSGEWTISNWIRKDHTDTGNANESCISYSGRDIQLAYNNINNSGGFEMIINGNSVAHGDVNTGIQEFIHIVFTYDGSAAEYYLNGNRQGIESADINAGISTTTLGTGSDGTDGGATITLDRTSFYDKYLDETEIINLCQTGTIFG